MNYSNAKYTLMKKIITALLIAASITAYSQVQLVSGGSANAYTLSFPGVFSYSNGISVTFKSNFANTSAATINVNGLGAKALKKQAVLYLPKGISYLYIYYILMGIMPQTVLFWVLHTVIRLLLFLEKASMIFQPATSSPSGRWRW